MNASALFINIRKLGTRKQNIKNTN